MYTWIRDFAAKHTRHILLQTVCMIPTKGSNKMVVALPPKGPTRTENTPGISKQPLFKTNITHLWRHNYLELVVFAGLFT